MTDNKIDSFEMQTSTERKQTTQLIWAGPRAMPDELAKQVREFNG